MRFPWSKDKSDPELTNALTITATQNATKENMSDRELQKLLGIDRELIHDNFIEHLLEARSIVSYKQKGKDGKEEERVFIDWNMVALRFVHSHLNRTSFITKDEAELMKLYVESILIRVKMQMKEHEFDLGQGNFLDSLAVQARLSIDDSIDGRKARLLKTIPKVSEVYVNPERKKGQGWSP